MKTKNIAIFASGEGTNAQNIVNYFEDNNNINVVLVVSNKPGANVLNRAKKANIPTLIINRMDFYESDSTIQKLIPYNIDLIILAGFLWLIPNTLIKAYPNKIINIHPALLPSYGGKGMFGMNVHKAVIDAKEKESGITIHYVNEKYDEGKIIAKYKCNVLPTETPETLAAKIHELEQQYFPEVIEQLLST